MDELNQQHVTSEALESVEEVKVEISSTIGSMETTGKSQVLKALMRFFETRNESHQFVVIAPMGSTAALLRRSMYYSIFGVNDREESSWKEMLL